MSVERSRARNRSATSADTVDDDEYAELYRGLNTATVILLGAVMLIGCIGIVNVLALSMTTAAPAPLYGDWTRVCTASTETTQLEFTPLGHALGQAIDGIPIGAHALRPVTRSVCEADTWQCPVGRTCDPAARPLATGPSRTPTQ